MGRLVVVRHAEAGRRQGWEGDDRMRPLTAEGRRQAEALVGLLSAVPLTEIRSSPYLRCRQTVEPLARARSLPVLDDETLAEGGSLDPLLELVARAPDGASAACTHGDVLEDLVRHLIATGTVAEKDAGGAKGGTWVLELDRSGVTVARYLPPPEV